MSGEDRERAVAKASARLAANNGSRSSEVALPSETLGQLRALRERMLPMLRTVAMEYRTRTDPGYPVILDNVESGGYFGILLAPGYGLSIMAEDGEVVAQLNIVGWRTDVRSSANKEKFTSVPFAGTRPVSSRMSDGLLRNILSELLSFFNTQPLMLNVTDS